MAIYNFLQNRHLTGSAVMKMGELNMSLNNSIFIGNVINISETYFLPRRVYFPEVSTCVAALTDVMMCLIHAVPVPEYLKINTLSFY